MLSLRLAPLLLVVTAAVAAVPDARFSDRPEAGVETRVVRGRIVDGHGAGLADLLVRTSDGTVAVRTRADGTFAIAAAPGARVVVTAPGDARAIHARVPTDGADLLVVRPRGVTLVVDRLPSPPIDVVVESRDADGRFRPVVARGCTLGEDAVALTVDAARGEEVRLAVRMDDGSTIRTAAASIDGEAERVEFTLPSR